MSTFLALADSFGAAITGILLVLGTVFIGLVVWEALRRRHSAASERRFHQHFTAPAERRVRRQETRS